MFKFMTTVDDGGWPCLHVRRKRREGPVLALVLVVMVVLCILGMGMLSLRSANSIESARCVAESQAFWMAEAGLQHVRGIANMNRKPFEDLGLLGQAVVEAADGRGSYVVDIEDDPDTEIDGHYVITSTGVASGGRVCVVRQRAQIQSYASYIHASHFEWRDGPIHFGTGDVVDGEIYSNDEINIYGSPRLLQMVRSAARTVNYDPGSGAGPHVFEGGLTLGAPPLDFAGIYSQDHIEAIQDLAQDGGLSIDGNSTLVFQDDGSVVVQTMSGTTTYDLSSYNGAIYIDGNAMVSGVLDGNVTVAVDEGIGIPSAGIQYESASGANTSPHEDGFDSANVNDALGLIARNAVLLTGQSTTPIHAAILITSEGQGFSCLNPYAHFGSPEVRLYGSLSQYRRGVLATTSGTGFLKNYKYDTRFRIAPPPYYPYSAYAYSDWRRIR